MEIDLLPVTIGIFTCIGIYLIFMEWSISDKKVVLLRVIGLLGNLMVIYVHFNFKGTFLESSFLIITAAYDLWLGFILLKNIIK